MAPLAVKVVPDPLQIVTDDGEIETVGKALTVTVADDVAVQPLVVPVTRYVVVELGETVVPATADPLLHK